MNGRRREQTGLANPRRPVAKALPEGGGAISRNAGILCAVVAAAAYGTNPLFAVPLFELGMSVDSVLFYRYLVATAMFGLLLLARRRSFRIARTDMVPLATTGLFLALTSYSLYKSYTLMDTGVASTILYVHPLMIAAIMAVFFGERITGVTVFCILTAMTGVGVLCITPNGLSVSVKGVALVLFSALSNAIYMVLIQTRALRPMDSLKLSFYSFSFASLLYIALIGLGPGLDLPSAAMTSRYAVSCGVSPLVFCLACILLMAYVPTVLSFALTAKAIQTIGPTPTGILGALEPGTAFILGILVFNEPLNLRKILGIALIVTAVMVLVMHEKARRRSAS